MAGAKSVLHKIIGKWKAVIKSIQNIMIFIVNTLLLSIIYLFFIGATAIFAKVVGKKFLRLEKQEVNTYWIVREDKINSKESYYKQF